MYLISLLFILVSEIDILLCAFCQFYVSMSFFKYFRQEEERQELYRRHQHELLSYKMHHLRAHYDGKCCFHSKSVQSAAASSQTGNIPFSSFATTYLHSKEQHVGDSSVSHSVYQSMHHTQGGGGDSQNKTYVQEIKQPRPSDVYLPTASCSVTMPSELCSSVKACEPTVMGSVSDPRYVRDQSIQHAYEHGEIPHLTPGQVYSIPSNVGISASSHSTFTVPPVQMHDMHCNRNMAALSKKTAVELSVEGAPHSSPQTVRRIINATSALNVNPTFYQTTPLISEIPVPQQVSNTSAPVGHVPMLNVSEVGVTDATVSSPSTVYFSQSSGS